MLYLILIDVVVRRLEVHRELGVIRQRLVLRVVLVQREIVVIRYMRVRLDRCDVPRLPGLAQPGAAKV